MLNGWRQFTINPEAIASAFGETDPSLREIRLMKLELSEDGPTLNLSLALNDYPQHPPTRWRRERNNAVSIQLQCLDVISLSLNRLSGDSDVSCEIDRGEASSLRICITGSAINVLVVCNFIKINHVTPYLKG